MVNKVDHKIIAKHFIKKLMKDIHAQNPSLASKFEDILTFKGSDKELKEFLLGNDTNGEIASLIKNGAIDSIKQIKKFM